jgi:hypothetical protein
MPRKPAKASAIVAPTSAQIASVANGGLIRLDKHQETVFWSDLRTLFLLWRRQAGKSFTLGAWSFRRMAEVAGHLVVLCSASIALGKEWVFKEAQVWRIFTQAYRDLLAAQGAEAAKLTTGADDDQGRLLDIDAVADLFEHQKLETRLWHSRTVYSRSIVVAPNPDTAVGWTGDVGMDEVGRIECLKDLLEALGPIMTRHRHLMMRMATTISPDDAHISREIHGVRPEQPDFIPNAAGSFYTSKSGYIVHRFDAYDAALAAAAGSEGLKLYDDKTGAEVTPDEHRAAALDKDAEDRNYFLKETLGGTAAIPAGVMTRCMNEGRGKCLAVDITEAFGVDDIPRLLPSEWPDLLAPTAPRLSLGYDIATTTKKKSNPSSITLMQQMGLLYLARLIVRFKTADPAVARAIIDHLLFRLPHGLKIRGLGVDASNEKFYAIETQKYFRGRLPVHLIVAGETLEHRGETITYKSLLGNDLINTATDGYLALPASDWLERDWRLVKLDQGRFYADVDGAGNHADTFDSTKLAKHELSQHGPARAEAVAVGSMSGKKPDRIRDPFARRTPPAKHYA